MTTSSQSTELEANALVGEKVDQAVAILQEKNVDLWLTFVRETSAVHDPVLPYIYGHDVTWQSAFILTSRGERIAILGHFDSEATRRMGVYSEVIGYHEAFSAPLRIWLLTTPNARVTPSMCPPRASVTAGDAPLKGTMVRPAPVSVFTVATFKSPELPAPAVPMRT